MHEKHILKVDFDLQTIASKDNLKYPKDRAYTHEDNRVHLYARYTNDNIQIHNLSCVPYLIKSELKNNDDIIFTFMRAKFNRDLGE